jgi:hypothetical protein
VTPAPGALAACHECAAQWPRSRRCTRPRQPRKSAPHGIRVPCTVEDAHGADPDDNARRSRETLGTRGVGGAHVRGVEAHDGEVYVGVREDKDLYTS